MDPIARLEKRMDDIERRQNDQIKLATVVEVDTETARLTCESENLVQSNIPFFTARAGEDMTYWLPSPGELGYLLSPSGDTANAVFLPGIFFADFPVPEQNERLVKRLFRDGTQEQIDTENSEYKITIGQDSVTQIVADTEKIEQSHSGNKITIDGDQTAIERPQGKIKVDNAETLLERALGLIKQAVGSNSIELNTILANIVGAHILPTGITTFQTATGPVFFAPAPSPASLPPPPAAAVPVNGKATRVPPSTVQNVGIPKGTFAFTIPPLTVTGTAGTVPVVGTTVALPVVLQVTATGVTLAIPGKAL